MIQKNQAYMAKGVLKLNTFENLMPKNEFTNRW